MRGTYLVYSVLLIPFFHSALLVRVHRLGKQVLSHIWNASAVSLFLPAFDDTGSIGSSPRRVAYTSRFLAGNMEAELKPTTISSLLLFYVFLSFLFS